MAVEVWLFDAMAASGNTAFTVSFVHDVFAAPAGFQIQANATWADATIWSNPLIFPESVITSKGSDLGQGRVVGVWCTEKDDSKVGFEVVADLSTAVVMFEVPSKITGTLTQKSLGYPCLLRLITMADAAVDITFYSKTPEGETTGRWMIIDKDQRAAGGVDRS